jgi:hypothetical protein
LDSLQPRGRVRCTSTLATFDATEMHVATAGDLCALHCHTHHGTVVIRLPLAVLIARARGSLDGNGHPFPIIEDKEARLARECALPVTPRKTHQGRKLDPEIETAYRAAFDDFLAGACATKRAALLRHLGAERYNPFVAWSIAPAQRAYAAAFRAPIRKPSGGL